MSAVGIFFIIGLYALPGSREDDGSRNIVFKAMIAAPTQRYACMKTSDARVHCGYDADTKTSYSLDWVLQPGIMYYSINGDALGTAAYSTSGVNIYTGVFMLEHLFAPITPDYLPVSSAQQNFAWTGMNPDWTASFDDNMGTCNRWASGSNSKTGIIGATHETRVQKVISVQPGDNYTYLNSGEICS